MFGKYLLFGFLRAAESLSWPGAGQGRGRGQSREAGSCSPCPSSNEDKYCLVMIEWLDRSGHHDLDTGPPTKLEPLSKRRWSRKPAELRQFEGSPWNWIFPNCFHHFEEYLRISLLWTESANFSNIKQWWYLLSWPFSGQLSHNSMSGLLQKGEILFYRVHHYQLNSTPH